MLCTPARFAAAIRVRMIPCFSAVETPEVGSSSRMMRGLSAKADATSSTFFSPWDKVAAGAGHPLGDLADQVGIELGIFPAIADETLGDLTRHRRRQRTGGREPDR